MTCWNSCRPIPLKFSGRLGIAVCRVSEQLLIHDDVFKWKHFPRYWPFVRGIHRIPAQRPVTGSFDVFFDLRLNKRLGKQSRGWWFETLSRPLWRHCNETLNVNFVSLRNIFKSNQVYCYTNNINHITPYNRYNEALHIKYISQLHLAQIKVPV